MTTPDRPVATGLALMAIAMLAIPTADGIAKYMSADYSPLFLAWARYGIASLLVLPVAAWRRGPHVLPAERRGSHLLRTVCMVTAMSLYFLAIANIPLAAAASAYFIGPIIGVLLAALLLKERLTRRKLGSLALGFAGAAVILGPLGAVEPGILLAFAAGVCFAVYLIATRQAAAASDTVKTLAFQCIVGAALLTPLGLLFWTTPALADLPLLLGLGAVSAVCHLMSITAFRYAEASTLAPLVYLELIGAAFFGYLVFGDVPGSQTIFGAALIVSGGLLLLSRTR